MNKRERRFLQSEVILQAGETPKISGYCAVFDKRSDNLGGFVEEIDPGAFDECLAGSPDVVGLFNHSNDMVLGRTTSGTMRLHKDATGIRYDIDPPNTSYAKDLIAVMERGDVKSSSFGFYCKKDNWYVDKQTGDNVRRLMKVEIFDASVTTVPAYPDTTSQVRSLFPDDKGHVPEEITSKLAELRHAQRKEKRGRSILSAVSDATWMITPEKLETICAFLANWSDGNVASKEQVQAALMGFDQENAADQNAAEKSPVAVIKVYGTIGQKMNMLTEFSGGCSCDGVTRQLRAALADESITTIVLDIDSPGGTVTGVPELSAEIFAAREQKPIIAVANGLAASAALYIGSAASKFICIPSGEVGSLGVYRAHQDVSEAMDKAGVKITFIHAGEYKVEGNPYEKPTGEFFEYQQKKVNDTYDEFVAFVAKARGVSVETALEDFGKGRTLNAKDALAVGLIDEIATFDQVIASLLTVNEPIVSAASVSEEQAVAVVESETVAEMDEDDDCDCDCLECEDGDCDNCSADPTCYADEPETEATAESIEEQPVAQVEAQLEAQAEASEEDLANAAALQKVRSLMAF